MRSTNSTEEEERRGEERAILSLSSLSLSLFPLFQRERKLLVLVEVLKKEADGGGSSTVFTKIIGSVLHTRCLGKKNLVYIQFIGMSKFSF